MKKIAFAGSSSYSLLILKEIFNSDWQIAYVLVPAPRLKGRKKILTESPVALFCRENRIKFFYVDKKINEVKEKIKNIELDLFLVMDFGFFLPNWLINLPKHKTLNIHPSLLPKWRGSSPGQFVLLFGQKVSAITLMRVNEKMDQGEIIKQLKFKIEQNYNQANYYDLAFNLIKKELIVFLDDYIKNRFSLVQQPQNSPTPLARMLKKQDSYLDFTILKKIILNQPIQDNGQLYQKTMEQLIENFAGKSIQEPLLMFLLNNSPRKIYAKIIWQAFQAFYKWPGIWTKVETNRGLKIMKILDLQLVENTILIKKVKIEGKNEANFNEIKNQIIW